MTSAQVILLFVAVFCGPPLLFALGVLGGAIFVRGTEDSYGLAVTRILNSIYARFMHGVRAPETDKLPATGPCIVVANHRSGVDPQLVATLTRRKIHYLMAAEYYHTFGVQWLFRLCGCIPVNRQGSDLAATRRALKKLKTGRVIGIFPQGGIREAEDPLGMGKAGVALLALRTGAPVVPVYVDGSPTDDSPFVALVKRSHSTVTCGEPLYFEFNGRKPSRDDLERVTGEIMRAILELKDRSRGVPDQEPREASQWRSGQVAK